MRQLAIIVVMVSAGVVLMAQNSGSCQEVHWIVDGVGFWVDFFSGDDPYTFAKNWYGGGAICVDGGMVY